MNDNKITIEMGASLSSINISAKQVSLALDSINAMRLSFPSILALREERVGMDNNTLLVGDF